MSEEAKAEPKKVCPFWGGHDCVEDRCGLWSFKIDSAGGTYACALSVLAESISNIEACGLDMTNHF